MGDDQLAFLEELIGHAYAFTEQSTGILPEVEDQPFEIAHLFKGFADFMLRRLLETGNVQVADAGLDHEMQIDAVTWNLVADHAELERMIGALAQHGNANRSSFWPLQQIGDLRGARSEG